MSITQKIHLKGNDSVFYQSIITGCLKTLNWQRFEDEFVNKIKN